MALRKVCNHPDLFEPRPIESPFHMECISQHFPAFFRVRFGSSKAKDDMWGVTSLTAFSIASRSLVWDGKALDGIHAHSSSLIEQEGASQWGSSIPQVELTLRRLRKTESNDFNTFAKDKLEKSIESFSLPLDAKHSRARLLAETNSRRCNFQKIWVGRSHMWQSAQSL